MKTLNVVADEIMKTVNIVEWTYVDSSGHGIVGVYGEVETAKEVLKALRENGDPAKVYKIVQVDVE